MLKKNFQKRDEKKFFILTKNLNFERVKINKKF